MDVFTQRAQSLGPYCTQCDMALRLIGCTETTLWRWQREELSEKDLPDWQWIGGSKTMTTSAAVDWCREVLATKYPHLLKRAALGTQGKRS